jgi:flagella basal body P-ring formation protein FlgA
MRFWCVILVLVASSVVQASIVSVQLRDRAIVSDQTVRLRDVAQWSGSSGPLANFADLPVALIPADGTRAVSIDDVRQTLRLAGANLARIELGGSTTCVVTWSDEPSVSLPARSVNDAVHAPASGSLRDHLNDLVREELEMDERALRVDFDREQDALLATPASGLRITPLRRGNLGEWTWYVRGESIPATQVRAHAAAWVDEVVLTRPVGIAQPITAEHVEVRRTLVERIPADPLLTLDGLEGTQASRDLTVGTVLTNRMVQPVDHVRINQPVLVTVSSGAIEVNLTATAMQSGSLGQTVRLKNDVTREVFQARITGPGRAAFTQAGEVP